MRKLFFIFSLFISIASFGQAGRDSLLTEGLINKNRLPLLNLKYPLLASVNADTLKLSQSYLDSLLAKKDSIIFATQTQLALKAPIANPNFTGTPLLATVDTLATRAYARLAATGAAWGSITGTLSAQTDLNSALNTANNNNALNAYILLGSVIKAEPIVGGLANVTSTFTPANQTIYFTTVYLPFAQTITGVKWYQANQGVYTANNYNGVALYSYSAGNWTYIDQSTNDGNIWKATANNIASKALISTHSLARGVYGIAFLYCNSAQTTSPTMGIFPALISGNMTLADFTNNVRLSGSLAAQTAMPNPTQAMSGLTQEANQWYFALY